MSVPLTLPEREPSHGYDLKRDYDAPLRYSQVYATLSRLSRDGKAVPAQLKQGDDPLDVLLADHSLYRLEADLCWIDHPAARLETFAKAVRR